MRIFAGLSRTDYEEVFRSIGALIDERGWTNISLLEVEDGLIIQATPKLSYKETKPRLETYLITDSDIERVMREAMLRRQQMMTKVLSTADEEPQPSRNDEPVTRAREAAAVAAPTPAAEHRERESEPVDWRDRSDYLPLPSFDEADDPTEAEGAQAPPPDNRGLAPFDPFSPMNLAKPNVSDRDNHGFDVGAARAAVVMAHIVAARLKSGMPMTGEDPDLASLLEQVQALDDSNIGDEESAGQDTK